MKCKSDYGRLSRKLNQVDIHMGIIFYRPEHMVFLKGCMQKKKNKKKTIPCAKNLVLHMSTYVCLCNK